MAEVMLPVSHVPQRQSGECLAACAQMVLAYLELSVSYDRLLKLLQIRPGVGAPASNVRELERLGVSVSYQQGTWTDLEANLTHHRPCLTPVQTGELPYWVEASLHIVVVVGLDERSIYLNDPAFSQAPIEVPRGEFDLAWLARDEYYAVIRPHD